MGIPSYFSYIVKNHSEIIRAFHKEKNIVDHLYMDCNSIIYDVVRHFEGIRDTKGIIQQVIVKINEYIAIIKPQKKVIIAFDGVAPVAKLEQQRNRRYKSWYQAQIAKVLFPNKTDTDWNTTVITPGTVFMKELNETVQTYYKKERLMDPNTNLDIIVSSSFDYGEGEHKIFQYIRSHPDEHKEGTTIVYGLDADLIMLSINHLPLCPHIYLFRETPEFIKSIDASLEPNEHYILDIPALTQEIMSCMTREDISTNTIAQKNKIHDYSFLCFFLGNDFLPHFPAVNIRTGGVDKMLNAYKATIVDNEWLTDGNTIVWKNVRKMVQYLAEQEEEMLKKETKQRDRREKFHYSIKTPEERLIKFDAIPTYERETEKYIHPFQPGWQDRYYESLFDIDAQDSKEAIVQNFCEGLEWTLKYYTTDCPDWKWKYKYNYPPLLEDLVRYMPYFEREMVPKQKDNPVSSLVQLCYVMPHESLQFLPKALETVLKEEYSHWYPSNCEYVWAYCKYFWESHVELPEIDLDILDKIVSATTV